MVDLNNFIAELGELMDKHKIQEVRIYHDTKQIVQLFKHQLWHETEEDESQAKRNG